MAKKTSKKAGRQPRLKSNQVALYPCPECKRKVGFKPFGVAYNHAEGDRKMLLLQCGGADCDALLALPHPLKS